MELNAAAAGVADLKKVEYSDNIEKFYQLARRARENCDYEEAEKYREELYNKVKVYGYKKRLEIVKNS